MDDREVERFTGSGTSMSNVVFYMTTCPSTSKMKSDIYRVKALLDAKKVVYKEVRSLPCWNTYNLVGATYLLDRCRYQRFIVRQPSAKRLRLLVPCMKEAGPGANNCTRS
jgi:hypothetical protein